jgi:hypothetical protein
MNRYDLLSGKQPEISIKEADTEKGLPDLTEEDVRHFNEMANRMLTQRFFNDITTPTQRAEQESEQESMTTYNPALTSPPSRTSAYYQLYTLTHTTSTADSITELPSPHRTVRPLPAIGGIQGVTPRGLSGPVTIEEPFPISDIVESAPEIIRRAREMNEEDEENSTPTEPPHPTHPGIVEVSPEAIRRIIEMSEEIRAGENLTEQRTTLNRRIYNRQLAEDFFSRYRPSISGERERTPVTSIITGRHNVGKTEYLLRIAFLAATRGQSISFICMNNSTCRTIQRRWGTTYIPLLNRFSVFNIYSFNSPNWRPLTDIYLFDGIIPTIYNRVENVIRDHPNVEVHIVTESSDHPFVSSTNITIPDPVP